MAYSNISFVSGNTLGEFAANLTASLNAGNQPIGNAFWHGAMEQMILMVGKGSPVAASLAPNIATVDPGAANDNTQGYQVGSFWINTANNRVWMAVSVATGAAVWALDGVVPGVGIEPASMTTQFGAGTATFLEEGNISRQMVAAGVQPGSTANDNVLAVYSIPANSFDTSGRGITITAAGAFGATANNKTVKLVFNPSSAVVGSAVVGGTTICTTGVTAQNGGGWQLQGTVFKYGAAASNTQICVNNGAVGTTHFGVTAPTLATAVESGAILVAVTGNAATVATDILFNWLEVNAMN